MKLWWFCINLDGFQNHLNTLRIQKRVISTQRAIFFWTASGPYPPLPKSGRVGSKKFFFGKHKFFVITSQNLLTDRKKISGARRTVLLLLKRSFFKPYLFRWSKVFRRASIIIARSALTFVGQSKTGFPVRVLSQNLVIFRSGIWGVDRWNWTV